MAASNTRDDALIAELNDLIQLDHDAVQAYTVAIDVVRDARYRETLVEYRADHKRHIEELAALVRERGGLPAELPHPTAPLKLTVQALGAAPGDSTLLLAFKAVEGQVRDKYRRIAAKHHPEDVRAVVERAAADEDTHYRWVEQSLRELRVGAGTLPHGVASAVEGLHKMLADPVEGLERQIMQAVGSLLGTTGTRGGGEAPSPAAAAEHAAREAKPASPSTQAAASTLSDLASAEGGSEIAGGDAQRFIAALRAVEEEHDIERMIQLFDDDSEICGPTDRVPHHGREGARHFWQMYRDSFAEIHSEFSKIVEGGDGTVMMEWKSTGRTITDIPVSYSGVSVAEIPDGRVRRFRAYFDTRELEIGEAGAP